MSILYKKMPEIPDLCYKRKSRKPTLRVCKYFSCNFLSRDPPPSKGKIFDTRFGLIHVQIGKTFFVEGPPPPGIARTCYGYAAGGMPLAFTQEDFLV